MRGLNTSLAGLLFVLLLAGMLLSNVVLMALWQRERVAQRYQMLAHMVRLAAGAAPLSADTGSRVPPVPDDEAVSLRFCLLPAAQTAGTMSQQHLPDSLCAAALHTQPHSCSDTCQWSFHMTPVSHEAADDASPARWLAVATPFAAPQSRTMLVALAARPGIVQLLYQNQHYMLAYILINALLLTIVGFFRLRRRLVEPLERLVRQADAFRAEDSSLFLLESRALGPIAGLNLSLHNMAQRIRQHQAALQQAVHTLEEQNQRLQDTQQEMIRTEKLAATGRLAAGLAHEIGNPLGVVQGYLELMRMEDCSVSERLEYSAKALCETARMHRLVGSLLQTARSRPPDLAEPLDLHHLLPDFIDSLRPQAFLQGIAVGLRLEADQAEVMATEDRVRQVLLNGLLNAVDAIRAAGQEEGRIVLSTRQVYKDGLRYLEICIADTGCGLAVEHSGKIFDPFFSTKAPGAGTGLGLSVSLTLVEAMGGSMRAQNNEEGGMGLYILLPQDQRKTDMKDVPQ